MILFYAAESNCVVRTLEAQLADYKAVRCRTLDTMLRRLRTPRHGMQVALLVISGKDEMAQLSSFRNLFRDMRLVIVLPHRDEETVAWAHTMGPRFIAYADNGFDQVGAVLDKMMQSLDKRTASKEVAF